MRKKSEASTLMASSEAPGIVKVGRLGRSTWVVALIGEHDMTNRDRLREKLAPLLRGDTAIVIDLSAATFIDSSTVKELIAAQERAEGVPTLQLAVIAPRDGFAKRVLDMLQTGAVLPIFETRAEALASSSPASAPGTAEK